MQNVIVCFKCKRWMGFTTLPLSCTAFCMGCRKAVQRDAAITVKPRYVQPSLFGDAVSCGK